MQKNNLLYVITKLELGGAQKQLLSIITHLYKERFTPFLFSAQDGLLLPEALSINGLEVKRSKFLERPINPLKDLLALSEIYWFIRKNNIQIVHTHSSKAGILGRLSARLAGAEVIIHTVHGWSFNDFQPALLRKVFIWLERLIARFTDKLIVVSYHDKQKGLDNHIGQENQYHLIRYGIDYTEFSLRDQNIRKELGLNPNDIVVGMISCFKPQKSPQDFIKLAYLVNQTMPNVNPVRNFALQSNQKGISNGVNPTRKNSPNEMALPNEVKFLLVGDGILRKKIEKLISKFNLQAQVILTGWRRDIYRILSAIDVFVLTSLWEGLPIAVLEAMVASIPVVVTHTGGVTEVIIEGKTGFLVAPRDIKNMSERLALLLKDENLRRQMGENAKNNLGFNFTLQNMVKNSQDLYYSLYKRRFEEIIFS